MTTPHLFHFIPWFNGNTVLVICFSVFCFNWNSIRCWVWFLLHISLPFPPTYSSVFLLISDWSPAGNRCHTEIGIIWGWFNKQTIYKGIGGGGRKPQGIVDHLVLVTERELWGKEVAPKGASVRREGAVMRGAVTTAWWRKHPARSVPMGGMGHHFSLLPLFSLLPRFPIGWSQGQSESMGACWCNHYRSVLAGWSTLVGNIGGIHMVPTLSFFSSTSETGRQCLQCIIVR